MEKFKRYSIISRASVVDVRPIGHGETILDVLRKVLMAQKDISDYSPGEENLRLEGKMKLHHLQQMMTAFQNHRPPPIKVEDPTGYSPAKYIEREEGSLNREEFKMTIGRILRTNEYDDQLEKMFTLLDVSGDGYVDWHEFCMFLLVQFQENDHLRSKRELPFILEPRIKLIVHNRQETTTKVVATDQPVKYITISKEGALSVWDTALHLEGATIMTQEEVNARGQKRMFKTWVTDAVYMANCRKLAVCSTSRDLRFFEASSSNVFEEAILYALPDVPYCMDYWFNSKVPNGQSRLFVGMDSGSIYIFTFTNAASALFETHRQSTSAAKGNVQKVFWQDIAQHSRLIQYTIFPNIHRVLVKRIRFLSYNFTLITCSDDPKSSLIINDFYRKRKPYCFKLNKGVECFDHSFALNLLVTGSADHSVRTWNPYVTAKPTSQLDGHSTGIIDVKILESREYIFSYSKDMILKVWCQKEHVCLQTLLLKFPCAQLGRQAEHGPFSLHLQGSTNALLVCSSDYVAALKIGQKTHARSLYVTTHNEPLSASAYNSYYRNVVTAADDSTVGVWEVDTGERAFFYGDAHGSEEITCISFDVHQRRLFTGARNGTIKSWNFRTGHCLQHFENVGENEVTSLLALGDKKVLLAVGWNRKIVMYDDSQPDNQFIRSNVDWGGGQIHHDDILDAAFCPPNLLATCTFDGELVIWSTETEKIFIRLRKGSKPSLSAKLHSLKGNEHSPSSANASSRPSSRHIRTRHPAAKGEPVPIDRLLFLPHRIRYPKAAILISSEAGIIKWWSVYGRTHYLGEFRAAHTVNESVLAVGTDDECSLMVTGDTGGFLQIWDIKNYCMGEPSDGESSPPPKLYHWKAHDSAIVSAHCISHESSFFIVTSSTDKSSRIWALDGRYVGTFGQKQLWTLADPSTWMHPDTPWTVEERSRYLMDMLQSGKTLKDVESEKSDMQKLAETDTKVNDGPTETLPEVNNNTSSGLLERAKTVPLIKKTKHEKEEFTYDKSASNLGHRFERELTRIKVDRKERRELFSDVGEKTVYKFGKYCSPFQALRTQDIQSTKIATNLPLARQMRAKGLRDVDEEALANINFQVPMEISPIDVASFANTDESLFNVKKEK